MRPKLGILLPNLSFELQDTICRIAEEMDISVVYAEGGFDNAIDAINRLLAIHPDVVSVLARINSAAILRKNINLPVIDLELSDFDFAKTIVQNSQIDRSPMLLFQFHGSSKIYNTEELSQVCGIQIRTTILNMHKNYDFCDIAHSMDIHRIITSVSTVAVPCRNGGLDVIIVPFSKEYLKRTLQYAVTSGIQFKKNTDEALRLKRSLDTLNDGLITIDSAEKITMCNRAMSQFMGIPANEIEGLNLNNAKKIYPFIDKVFKAKDEDVIHYKDMAYSVNIIYIPGTNLVSSTREVTSINELQKKAGGIRRRLITNNYTARSTFNDIIAIDSAMKETCSQAERYARTKSNILIYGESGTGKEILAQSIHNASSFSKGAFIAINCAAIPETLLESELFGYEEGAFTGAKRGGKAGLIELSHEGTLFLDEIGLIPFSLQAKLLRVIQERQISRIGGNSLITINNRIICATNENLPQLVENGQFREDLFYRINVLPIKIPCLRERHEDIIPLALYFIKKKSYDMGINLNVDKDQLRPLLNYDWPGNVRQLEAFIERLIVLHNGPDIKNNELQLLIDSLPKIKKTSNNIKFSNIQMTFQNNDDINPELQTHNKKNPSILKKVEEDLIKETYEKYNGNLTKIREELGISRTTLWKKLKEMDL